MPPRVAARSRGVGGDTSSRSQKGGVYCRTLSVGATHRLVATTLQSKSDRVAPTLTPPGPGSSLGTPAPLLTYFETQLSADMNAFFLVA